MLLIEAAWQTVKSSMPLYFSEAGGRRFRPDSNKNNAETPYGTPKSAIFVAAMKMAA